MQVYNNNNSIFCSTKSKELIKEIEFGRVWRLKRK